MRTIRILGYALLRALASLRRRPLIAALTVGVMTVALVLVGVAHMAEKNVRDLSEQWGSGVQMIVYLDEGTTESRAHEVSEALTALPAVESAKYVPPEEAMRHLQGSLGQHDELLEGIEASFLPASLEVRLMDGTRDLVSAHPVIERLEATASVEEVEFLGNWVDDFTALIGQVQRAGLWLVMIAGLIGIFTVVATMRLSAEARASELRVLQLMGAPAILRRGPNLIEGALLGVLGAAAASLLLWFGFKHGAPLVSSALSSSLGEIELSFLGAQDLVRLCLFGLGLGAMGGLVTNFSQERV
jgi:cell division transport system permease protein